MHAEQMDQAAEDFHGGYTSAYVAMLLKAGSLSYAP